MADSVAVDLTAVNPVAIDTNGQTTPIWPAFCLPWYPDEPPLVDQAARVHRRASRLDSARAERSFDLENRGRYHLAEGWLAMMREPDSLVGSRARLAWRPPGENCDVAIDFSQVVAEIVGRWSDPHRHLALVVPDGLGPGAREEILAALRGRFQSVQFVPRTIAGAAAWCENASLPVDSQSTSSIGGGRVGSLLVTTTPADLWEAALVPIRLEWNNNAPRLCPVHDRTVITSEFGVVGLEQLYSFASFNGAHDDREAWMRLMGPVDRTRPLLEAYRVPRATERAFQRYALPYSLDPAWQPEGNFEATLQAVKRTTSGGRLLDWIHFGVDTPAKDPDVFDDLEEAVGSPPQHVPDDQALRSAADIPRRIDQGDVPYYESLARVDMYVESRNAYHDPVPDWRPLIEATEVPVGKTYHSRVPITDLALPQGRQPTVDITVRRSRRGHFAYGTLKATQRDPQREADPLRIEARLDPGQGMARLEVRSQTSDRFHLTIREGDLTATDALPEVRYGWPPGSAWIVDHPSQTAPAFQAIERAPWTRMTKASLKLIRDQMNKWVLPRQLNVNVEALAVPEEIHAAFVYLGVFPSGTTSWTPALERQAGAYGNHLDRLYQQEPGLREAVLWNASWLYLRCPDSLLSEVRFALQRPALISAATLAVAGNCFSTEADYRLFHQALLMSIETNHPPAHQYWLRAFRNLARFRADFLSNEALSEAEQDCILEWFLGVFQVGTRALRQGARPGGNSEFLHCAYLAPHVLKRRRFDPAFLSEGSQPFNAVRSIFQAAENRTSAPKMVANLQCAREFLERTATSRTLQRLGASEG